MSKSRIIMGKLYYTGVHPGPFRFFRSRMVPIPNAPAPHPSIGYLYREGEGYCRLSSSIHHMISVRAGFDLDRAERQPRPQDIVAPYDTSRMRRKGQPLP